MAIKKYSKVFHVAFRDVNAHGHLRMNALVDYMQQIANEHARQLDFDFSGADNENGVIWVVSRAKMHIEKLLHEGDTLHIETYPAGIDKLFAVRRFDLFDASHTRIGYIIGDYILLDCKTYRPIRLKHLPGRLSALEWPYEGETLPKLKKIVTIEKEDRRKVRTSEIDLNQHMNNAHYIRFTVDLFSSETLAKTPIKSIQTNYIKSLTEGDEVKIIRGKDEDGNTLVQGMSLDESLVYWTSKIEFLDDLKSGQA